MTDDRHSAGSSDQPERPDDTPADDAAAGEDDAWQLELFGDPDATMGDAEAIESDGE